MNATPRATRTADRQRVLLVFIVSSGDEGSAASFTWRPRRAKSARPRASGVSAELPINRDAVGLALAELKQEAGDPGRSDRRRRAAGTTAPRVSSPVLRPYRLASSGWALRRRVRRPRPCEADFMLLRRGHRAGLCGLCWADATAPAHLRGPTRPRAKAYAGAGCHLRCHSAGFSASRSPTGLEESPRLRGLSCEPTPGLEPGTPSLRVKCSTS